MGLLANINLTEEQQKEFSSKLDAWKNEQVAALEKDIKSKYENRLNESEDIISGLKTKMDGKVKSSRVTEDGDLDFSDEETEILKKKLTEWKEKVQEETEDALGDKFFESYKQGEDKLKKDFSDKFIKTLKDIYEEVELSVRDKLKESAEFKAFLEIKKAIAPFIVEGEYTDSINEDIGKLKEIISNQKEQIDKTKVQTKLDQLLAGMPEDVREEFISNLGDVKTENELIEAFQRNIKFMKKIKDTVSKEINESEEEKTEDGEKAEGEKVEDEKEADEKPAEEKADDKEVVKEEEEKKEDGDAKPEEKPEEKAEEKSEEKAEGDDKGKAEIKKESVNQPPTERQIIDDIVRKSNPAKPSDEGKTSKDVDYDILTEDFKREEVKPENLRRIQELAGLV